METYISKYLTKASYNRIEVWLPQSYVNKFLKQFDDSCDAYLLSKGLSHLTPRLEADYTLGNYELSCKLYDNTLSNEMCTDILVYFAKTNNYLYKLNPVKHIILGDITYLEITVDY